LQNGVAIFSLALIGLSVVAIIIIMFLGGGGLRKPTPLQIFVSDFPLFALPLGALGIIALFVIGAVERRKQNTRRTN
jgi:hypothetical protein